MLTVAAVFTAWKEVMFPFYIWETQKYLIKKKIQFVWDMWILYLH